MAEPVTIPHIYYLFTGGFSLIAGLAGGAIGFYKSKSDFSDHLKFYRTAADCADCVLKGKVNAMEQDFKRSVDEIKEHTKSVIEFQGELKLINQMQGIILKKLQELKVFQDNLPELLKQIRDRTH